MSDYEYTDLNGVRMNIDGYTTEVNLYLTEEYKEVTAIIPTAHAPAVALAILEAAGHPLRTYQPGEMRDLADVAHDSLKRHLAYQEEQAAREAEDLKVADFFTKFDGLTPAFINDHDRRRYRAARDFFEEKQ